MEELNAAANTERLLVITRFEDLLVARARPQNSVESASSALDWVNSATIFVVCRLGSKTGLDRWFGLFLINMLVVQLEIQIVHFKPFEIYSGLIQTV